jgi:hypothetical protein
MDVIKSSLPNTVTIDQATEQIDRADQFLDLAIQTIGAI